MSDDEYYYDAEFEEFQDMLYDADPAPDLADDLADRATYSPVWQNNPTEELRDYFSDWEYYSDDYFDDDPALLVPSTKLTETGNKSVSGGGQQQQSQTSRRTGGKRKRVGGDDGPVAKRREVEALRQCFRGTVWKATDASREDTTVVYQQGRDSPVSLVLNSDIMHSAYSKRRGFGRGRVAFKRDETWANELSLEDMGLKTERSMSIPEQPEQPTIMDQENDSDYEGAVEVDYEESQSEPDVADEHRSETTNVLDLADAIVDGLIEANEGLSSISSKPGVTGRNGSSKGSQPKPNLSNRSWSVQKVLKDKIRVMQRELQELGVLLHQSEPKSKGRNRGNQRKPMSRKAKQQSTEAASDLGTSSHSTIEALAAQLVAVNERLSRESTSKALAGSSDELLGIQERIKVIADDAGLLETLGAGDDPDQYTAANGGTQTQDDEEAQQAIIDVSSINSNGAQKTIGRKRKLSQSGQNTTDSISSNRAKRVDSTAVEEKRSSTRSRRSR